MRDRDGSRDGSREAFGALTRRVRHALEALRHSGLFHHDTVLAPHRGVATPSPTTVERILVGEPGITYKYLGLRTFAYPWSAAATGGAGGGSGGNGAQGKLGGNPGGNLGKLAGNLAGPLRCLSLTNRLYSHI